MNNYLRNILSAFLLALILQAAGFSQADTLQNNADLIQTVLDESESGESDEGLLDIIEELRSNPVDINSAGISELQRIPGLNFQDAKTIIAYRQINGRYFSVNELRAAGIPGNVLERILPFLKVTNKERTEHSGSRFINKLQIRNRIVRRLKEETGFINHKFAGNRFHTYSRLSAQLFNKIKAGFLADKDPGEVSYNDLTSAYISGNDIGALKKLVLGDYSVQFGQGLAIWSPYSFSKSSNAIYPVNKNPDYLKEYRSSDENRFLRGIAATINSGRFSFSLFYSKNRFDARLDPQNGGIISTPYGGLHRTETEINKKNASVEKLFGVITSYSTGDKFNLGFLYYSSKFSNTFEPDDIYSLSGNKFNFYSLSFDIYFDKINLSGEASFNGTSIASIMNMQFAFGKDIAFIASVRNYPRNYFNLHSRGFGERTGTRNEFGIYNGIRWRTSAGTFNFYFDQFRFPFSTYTSPVPSSGNEFVLDYLSSKFMNGRLHLKLKREEKENSVDNNGSIELLNGTKSSARLELIYFADKNLRLKSRIEFSSFRINALNSNENGFLIFQDAVLKAGDALDISGRIIFFRTASFNTAIYEFENGPEGMFSLYGLYGEGIRWYFLTKIKLPRPLLFSIKYSETYKPEEKSLGSGYSTIQGNLDNSISVQLELSL